VQNRTAFRIGIRRTGGCNNRPPLLVVRYTAPACWPMARLQQAVRKSSLRDIASPRRKRSHCVLCYIVDMLCLSSIDNSDYMRNGDFVPTRLQAQQDAVHVVCQSKTRSNPENNVGLLTLAK